VKAVAGVQANVNKADEALCKTIDALVDADLFGLGDKELIPSPNAY